MFIRRQHIIVVVVTLLMASIPLAACSLPLGPTPDAIGTQNAIYTAAALTIQAQIQQTPIQPTVTLAPPPTEALPLPSDTPLSTATEIPAPTETPAPAEPIIPTDTPMPTFTSIPVQVGPLMITASTNTNCREGPSINYKKIGNLIVGDRAEVRGRNSTSSWWYIQNPGRPAGNYCWVWGETTHVEGETAALPVVTPPPLPTATAAPLTNVSVSFTTVHTCGGKPTAIFRIKNAGTSELESARITINNLTEDKTIYGPNTSNAPFMSSAGECPPGGDTLADGRSGYVGGEMEKPYSPSDKLEANIRLCTRDNGRGDCYTWTIRFEYPD